MESLLSRLGALRVSTPAIERWRTDAAALLFHLRRGDHPLLLAILGGTGTGKSTLVNRLLEADLSATSFRRTFTAGAVAVAADPSAIPPNWLLLPIEPIPPGAPAARGEAGKLAVVTSEHPLVGSITLIDTPDLDGDQPRHHAEADRVFRWADALVFLVTPEKYQMTELLPYYRLARRYAVAALFVMNKCEEMAVLEDFRKQLAARDWPDANIFAIPRDDAAWHPPPGADLDALREFIGGRHEGVPVKAGKARRHEGGGVDSAVSKQDSALRQTGQRLRCADLLDRLRDQIITPLLDQRREIDRLTAALRAMATSAAGLDVAPVTSQLQRRLQEQSVLYLMGPQRILDRVRQVPELLMRLPRTAWDLVRGNAVNLENPPGPAIPTGVPDFAALLADQFTILQSRLDDLVQGSGLKFQGSVEDSGFGVQGSGVPSLNPEPRTLNPSPNPPQPAADHRAPKIPPSSAAAIATEEITALQRWLEERWNATPRDTAILQRLLKLLPGGRTLTRYSEAAPYLLAVVVATHGAVFGPIDLIILGSFSLATWLGEKLSNEVTARTRQANQNIATRYAALADQQITRTIDWLNSLAPAERDLLRLSKEADDLSASLPQ